MESWFGQQLYPVRLEWGRDGARRAAERGDIVVVVDVLRFSTTVATAVRHGVALIPCRTEEEAEREADTRGAEVGGKGRRFSLSPLDYLEGPAGKVVALQSPNGAASSRAAIGSPAVIAAGLVNATAVGAYISNLVRGGKSVTVTACGERWEKPGDDGPIRFSTEDYLGAGAVLRAIQGSKSPEASVCEAAFSSALGALDTLLLACGSGVELADKGRVEDVIHAARLDLYDAVPMLTDGVFLPAHA
jgi:2-phosphosulfolactate phosphatase